MKSFITSGPDLVALSEVYPTGNQEMVSLTQEVMGLTLLSSTILSLGPRIEKCGCPIVITSSVRPSIHPSVCPSTLSLCCDNSNTSLRRTFKLCIWVIYQTRRTPLVFGIITSKVKVTGEALPDLVSILVENDHEIFLMVILSPTDLRRAVVGY